MNKLKINMENSYIKIYRSLLDWEWYKDSKMVHLFFHLLIKTNFKKGRFQGIDVERGQLITGLKSLSENTGLTTQSVRTCLEKLKSTGEITIKSTNKFSLITIVKYDFYQSFDELSTNKSTSKSTNQQQTNNKPTTTIEERKEEKENNSISPEEELLLNFDRFRSIYPGTKKGNFTEFDNLKKKHKDYKSIIPKLQKVIENQINHRAAQKQKGLFVPEWKNLSTWINNRCWEEEYTIETKTPQLTPTYDATDLFGTK